MESSIIPTLTGCRSSWSAFFAKHGLPETAVAFPDGTPIFAWCLHHEKLVEPLTRPIAERVSYILSKKPQDQHELRFLNLRPVSREHVGVVAAALAEYRKAWAAAWAEYEKAKAPARAEYDKAMAPALAEYEKARADADAEYDKAGVAAWAEYWKAKADAWAEYEKALSAARAAGCEALAPLHLVDVPDHTWNGRSIFASKSTTGEPAL